MRQRNLICVLIAGMTALLLTGCEKRITAVTDTETTAIEIVEAEETQSETVPEIVMESVDVSQVTEEVPDLREVYESSFGYRMKYDKAVFEYNQHGGYDEFVMKTKAFSSDPLVFFAAMRIEEPELVKVKDEVFGADAGTRTIGADARPALYNQSTEKTEDGKNTVYHETYLVELTSGEALLFEIQWFDEADGENTAGEQLSQMLQSLEINEKEENR